MIHVDQYGQVLAIRMSRSIFGRPFWWTTAYWVDGLLIDTGPRFAARALLYVLRNLPVDQVVITHAHEDQTGGLLAVLQQYPKAKIYAAPRTLPWLATPERRPLPFYRRFVWGVPQACRTAVSLDTVNNVLHTTSYQFRAVETPGHTSDHIALFEPHQRWLFSGDVFGYSQTNAWAAEADLFGVICSLRTLADLRPERIFPSDGRISRTPLPELHGKIGQLLQITREVAQLDALGLTKDEIVLRLFHKEPPLYFWTAGHYSAANLVDACRSYNALFTQLDDQPASTSRRELPDEQPGSSNSSNWPFDWEDLIR
ncbi:MAG: MBL fold metallo-hydrolase [Caldilineaceae bacterium]|nr:MBL fold metallo-hydrolase [Caldilineaceae bacterium]